MSRCMSTASSGAMSRMFGTPPSSSSAVLRTTGLERAERLFEHQYQVYWVH